MKEKKSTAFYKFVNLRSPFRNIFNTSTTDQTIILEHTTLILCLFLFNKITKRNIFPELKLNEIFLSVNQSKIAILKLKQFKWDEMRKMRLPKLDFFYLKHLYCQPIPSLCLSLTPQFFFPPTPPAAWPHIHSFPSFQQFLSFIWLNDG